MEMWRCLPWLRGGEFVQLVFHHLGIWRVTYNLCRFHLQFLVERSGAMFFVSTGSEGYAISKSVVDSFLLDWRLWVLYVIITISVVSGLSSWLKEKLVVAWLWTSIFCYRYPLFYVDGPSLIRFRIFIFVDNTIEL